MKKAKKHFFQKFHNFLNRYHLNYLTCKFEKLQKVGTTLSVTQETLFYGGVEV